MIEEAAKFLRPLGFLANDRLYHSFNGIPFSHGDIRLKMSIEHLVSSREVK